MTLGGGLTQAVMREGGTQIRLAFMPPGADIEQRLENGTTDMLIDREGSVRELFMQRVLLRTPYRTAQRKDHLRGSGLLRMGQFCALDHMVVPGKEAGFKCPVDAALEQLGQKRRIAVSVESLAAVPNLLTATDLVCTLPFSFSEYENNVECFEPPVKLDDYIYRLSGIRVIRLIQVMLGCVNCCLRLRIAPSQGILTCAAEWLVAAV